MEWKYCSHFFFALLIFGRTAGEKLTKDVDWKDNGSEQVDNGSQLIDSEHIVSQEEENPVYINRNQLHAISPQIETSPSESIPYVEPTSSDFPDDYSSVGDFQQGEPATKRTSIGISLRKTERLLTRSLTLDNVPVEAVSNKKTKGLLPPVLNNTQVIAQVGGTTTLSCYTGHISDEVVTWLKREDDQLLTIGQELYANEARFSASISHSTKAWELFVRDVQISDAGQYECQLTTHPPVTFLFTLKVTQAKADIRGPKEVHIEEGSQLDLQCIVKDSPSPPIYIFWIHNGTMVNYESQRGLEVHLENFVSSLVISKVMPSDAGIYTCDPHLAERANVVVHVVTGEKPAAMQHGRNVNGSGSAGSPFAASNSYASNFACVIFLMLPSLILQLQSILLCGSCQHINNIELVSNTFSQNSKLIV